MLIPGSAAVAGAGLQRTHRLLRGLGRKLQQRRAGFERVVHRVKIQVALHLGKFLQRLAPQQVLRLVRRPVHRAIQQIQRRRAASAACRGPA